MRNSVKERREYVAREKSHYSVQVLDRAIDILELFGDGADELGVADIAQRLDLHRATAHRLVSALASRRMLGQNPDSGKYFLGIRLFELGSQVPASRDLRRIARPFLTELVARGGETAHLVVLDGRHIAFVDKVESPNLFRMVSVIGGQLPAHCSGSGKALLAQLSDEELSALLMGVDLEHQTENSVVEFQHMRAHLAQVRRDGYAIDDEETQRGLRCIGAPVFDRFGRPVAGLSVSGPVARIGDDRVAFYVELVTEVAARLSRALGFRGRG